MLIYNDQFQFVEQNGAECWCDLGANTLSGDTHDIHDIARKHTINARYHTIFNDIHDIKRRY